VRRRRREQPHLLHVGHSSFEAGCPLGQLLAWHGVVPMALIV
jgi:hypothetical protein